MTLPLVRIAEKFIGTPLAYHPGKAETIARLLGPRLVGGSTEIVGGSGVVEHVPFATGRPSAGILADGLGEAYERRGMLPFAMVEDVAVIPIEGSLVHKGGWIGASSGVTSYQGLGAQIDAAARAKEVRGVVFEVDSYGGEVNGLDDVASAIRELSQVKPTIAILTDYAFSAGFWLASQARQVFIPRQGEAGSIGVLIVHADFSGKLAKDGITMTMIHAGTHKVAGNPFEPLPEAVRARLQASCDRIYDEFAAAVGRGRGSRFTKEAAKATEAQVYSADEAKRLGMVDAIGSPRAVFEAFLSEIRKGNRK